MPRYDAVIVGAGVAGLSIAARLCRRGQRVAVFDLQAEPGGISADLHLEETAFPAAPEPLYGFEEHGPLREICTELGIQINLKKGPSNFQVALPGHRITVSSDRDQTLAELRREFPGEIDRLAGLYRALDAVAAKRAKKGLAAYFARKRTADDFLQSFRLGRATTAFFDLQARAFFGTPLAHTGLADLAVLAVVQPQVPVDGINGILQQIRDFISGKGGDFRLGEPWPEVRFRGKRAIGLRTGSGDVDAGIVVLNAADPDRERRLMLRVRAGVLPVSMHRTVLCLPAYDISDRFIALSVSGAEGASPAAEEVCSLSVTLYGPSAEVSSEGLVDMTGEIIPFLRDFIVAGGEADLRALRHPPLNPGVEDRKRPAQDGCGSVRKIGRSLYVLPGSHAGVGRIVRESAAAVKGAS